MNSAGGLLWGKSPCGGQKGLFLKGLFFEGDRKKLMEER